MSYDNYDPGGLTIEELSNQLMALQSRLASTISDVKREDDKLTEKQSQILQTIDSISLSVSEIQTTTEGHGERLSSVELRADGIDLTVSELITTTDETVSNVSSLTLRADSIESTVTALDTRIGAAETSITQNAGQIALKASIDYVDGVSSSLGSRISSAESSITQNATEISLKVSQTDYTGQTIASLINQTADTITIAAQAIDLYGITHVNGELYIGDPDYTGTKTIWFNNAGNISATGFGYLGLPELKFNLSNLNFEDISYMWFNQMYPTEVYGKVDFANATVTGLDVTVSFG